MRNNGKILWQKTHKARQPETEYKGFILNHGSDKFLYSIGK